MTPTCCVQSCFSKINFFVTKLVTINMTALIITVYIVVGLIVATPTVQKLRKNTQFIMFLTRKKV